METITLKDTKYHNSVDIKKKYPKIFKKCITIRAIIDIQDLEEDDYCFAYFKNKKWKLSKQSYPRAKLLLTIECFNKLLKKSTEKKEVKKHVKPKNEKKNNESSDDDSSDSDDDVDDAPPILKLKDNEKFKDEKGRTIEIETRGERDSKKCYFKVKDIAKGFKIPQYKSSVVHKNSKYVYGGDYVYFDIKECSPRTKQLYLTLSGMQRLMYCSKDNNILKHNLIIEKWICTVFGKTFFETEFKIIDNSKSPDHKYNYTYIATSPMFLNVKIGMWHNSIKSLESRYKTYYGDEVKLCVYPVNNAETVESNFKAEFKKYNMCGEIYNITHMKQYIKFMSENVSMT